LWNKFLGIWAEGVLSGGGLSDERLSTWVQFGFHFLVTESICQNYSQIFRKFHSKKITTKIQILDKNR
jgi:hypothetical protein